MFKVFVYCNFKAFIYCMFKVFVYCLITVWYKSSRLVLSRCALSCKLSYMHSLQLSVSCVLHMRRHESATQSLCLTV